MIGKIVEHALIPALWEEPVFRILLMGALIYATRNNFLSNAIQSIIFGAFHLMMGGGLIHIIATSIVGFVCGELVILGYVKSRKDLSYAIKHPLFLVKLVSPAILIHFIYNSSIILFAYLGAIKW